MQLPKDRLEVFQWARFFYESDPQASCLIDTLALRFAENGSLKMPPWADRCIHQLTMFGCSFAYLDGKTGVSTLNPFSIRIIKQDDSDQCIVREYSKTGHRDVNAIHLNIGKPPIQQFFKILSYRHSIDESGETDEAEHILENHIKQLEKMDVNNIPTTRMGCLVRRGRLQVSRLRAWMIDGRIHG